MYRILVADDEKVTRQGIVAILQRGLKEEIECIEASNGQEALEITGNHSIHMVITDICMPMCSGLEFIRELRNKNQDMTVFIISGYENFDYAKQAVKLGVKDYIMKPVNKEEFLGQIENCLADMKKKQMDAQRKYMEKREHEQMVNHVMRENLLSLLRGAGRSWNELAHLEIAFSTLYCVGAAVEYEITSGFGEHLDFVVKNIVDEYLSGHNQEPVITVTYGLGCLALILEETSEDSVRKKGKMFAEIVALIEKFCRVRAVVGVGDVSYGKENLYRSFRHSLRAANMKIYDSQDKVFFYADLQRREGDRSIFSEITNINDEEEVLKVFERCLQKAAALDNVMHMRYWYREISDTISQKWQAAGNDEEDAPVMADFSNLWSPFELRREIRAMLQHYKYMNDVRGENNRMVLDIMDYTLEHITEDIDLNYLADHFSKSPGYIGTLFRKGYNMGFNEFVTSERVKLATRLLEDDSLSIQKVGELCGYYNPKYFSVVFKKITGCSPKAYRQERTRRSMR